MISSVYNCLPEKGKNLVSVIGHGAVASLMTYGLVAAYQLEVCKWHSYIPLCQNELKMTFTIHLGAAGVIFHSATTAFEELTQFFR